MNLDLHTIEYEPLGGSSYIPLPAFLAAEEAIINLYNEDDECLKYAITRALNPVEKPYERIEKKLRETSKVLNWEGLKFPVNLVISINFKIIIFQFLLMYLVTKIRFILLE